MKNLSAIFIFFGVFNCLLIFAQNAKDSIRSNVLDTAKTQVVSKNIYFKRVNDSILSNFKDTSNKIVITNNDESIKFLNKFTYAQSFFPNMEYAKLKVRFKKTKKIVTIRPAFLSIFQAPKERTYKITYSNLTETTLDSVILKNLSVNSQVGLIAIQLSRLEDFRTSWFFDNVYWYFKQFSTKAKNKINYEDELRAVEMGLGYEILSLNKEKSEKLKIEKWQNTKGYAEYIKGDINRSMSPEIIMNFISDLPIYNTKVYQ